jgi:hypothetical protein
MGQHSLVQAFGAIIFSEPMINAAASNSVPERLLNRIIANNKELKFF